MPRTDFFDEPDLDPTNEPWDFPLERVRKRRRVALTSTFVVLFFAGAAFTAGAGDLAVNKLQANDPCAEQANAPLALDDTCATTAATEAGGDASDATATEPASDPAVPAEPAPAAAPVDAAPQPEPAATAADEPTVEAASLGSTARAAAAAPAAPAAAAATAASPSAAAPDAAPVLKQTSAPTVAVPLKPWAAPVAKHGAKPTPEVDGNGTPTIWLNRLLPDPTPPAKRLTPAFASRLAADAKAANVDWSLMLGFLRASGQTGPVPARNSELTRLGSRISSLGTFRDDWAAAIALDGHTEFADQVAAFARYDRAVGLRALVRGLEAAKPQLTKKVLNDPAIFIYAGGRDDLANDRVDVRVIALIAYLRETFGEVTVSCLVSGHGLYARPGVISAHIYGRAVDIAALGSTSILGHQQPGSVTEHAVRDVLLLPSELQPQQVISLIGLGGPSFPLANHDDHIHVGY
jgi:hypothetical protein